MINFIYLAGSSIETGPGETTTPPTASQGAMFAGIGIGVVGVIGGMAGIMVFARKRKQKNEKQSGVQGYLLMSLWNSVF